MPEAPPRKVSEARQRDESWKEANAPRRAVARRKGGAGPFFLVVLLFAAAGGYIYRAKLVGIMRSAKLLPVAPGAEVAVPTTTVSLATNYQVDVEINGEVVGQTPIRNFPVKAGSVVVHYFRPAQGIDKTVTYTVADGQAFTHREDFEITRVQFRTDLQLAADIYLNGKRIGQTGAAPMVMAVGVYDLVAKADNDTFEGSAHVDLSGHKNLHFVTFKLHKAR